MKSVFWLCSSVFCLFFNRAAGSAFHFYDSWLRPYKWRHWVTIAIFLLFFTAWLARNEKVSQLSASRGRQRSQRTSFTNSSISLSKSSSFCAVMREFVVHHWQMGPQRRRKQKTNQNVTCAPTSRFWVSDDHHPTRLLWLVHLCVYSQH